MQAAHQLCTEQAPRRPRPLHHGSPFPVFPGRGLGVRFLLMHPHPPPPSWEGGGLAPGLGVTGGRQTRLFTLEENPNPDPSPRPPNR